MITEDRMKVLLFSPVGHLRGPPLAPKGYYASPATGSFQFLFRSNDSVLCTRGKSGGGHCRRRPHAAVTLCCLASGTALRSHPIEKTDPATLILMGISFDVLKVR